MEQALMKPDNPLEIPGEQLEQLETSLGAHVPHLHVLFESSPDCLKLIDAEGRLVSMNTNGCALMDIEDFAPLKGQAWVGFWPDPEPVKQALKTAEQKGFAQFQAFCPTAIGVPKWWDVQITRVLNPGSDAVSFLSSSRDITYLKKVELELKEKNAELERHITLRDQELHSSNEALVDEIKGRRVAEEQFQAAFEHAPVGAAIISLEGEYLNLNEAACDILGYPCEAMVGKRIDAFIHPEEGAQRKAELKQLLTGELKRIETQSRYIHRDGHVLWVNAAASLVRDEQGQPKYLIAHIVDVTRQKRTESELAAEKARLETILDTMSEGLIVRDVTGKIIDSNPGARQILGMEQSKLEDERPPDVPQEVLREDGSSCPFEEYPAMLALETGEAHHGVLGIRKPDNELSWILVNAVPTLAPDGAVETVISAFADITDLRNKNKAVERYNERLETILNTMLEGLVVQDADGQIIECNPSAEQILGLSRDQLEGKTSVDPSWRAVRDDGSPFPGEEHYSMVALRTGEAQRGGLMGIHKPGGELTWILVNATPTFNHKGDVEAVVSVFTDITDLRNSAQSLQSYAERLERSNRDLQDFAFAASHDLQEPLRMVSSYVQLLQKRYGPQLDDDANEFIDFAVDGASRMRTLISDLLAYSRVDTRSLSAQQVDMNGAFSNAQANLASALTESAAHLHCDTLPTVQGDASQLATVFQNLIGNALKYRSDTPPEIHVSAEQTRDGGKDVWRFAVRDNGIGLDEKNAEAIFTLFTRLHTRDAYAGNGIGLTLCRRILERHGGKIWVTSTPGQGATFYFTLPR